MLVNIGSNEGLFSAAFVGNIEKATAEIGNFDRGIAELARRLAALPKEVETIVFNGLIRPRTATNLMPLSENNRSLPREVYYDAYCPSLFNDEPIIPRSKLESFDKLIEAHNDNGRIKLERIVGHRLLYVDMYKVSDSFDDKHHGDRPLRIGSHLLTNVPLKGAGTRINQGGLTGIDNMHPTAPGYALMADAVLKRLNSNALTDKAFALQSDTLLQAIPDFLNQRTEAVLDYSKFVRDLGRNAAAAPPEKIQART